MDVSCPAYILDDDEAHYLIGTIKEMLNWRHHWRCYIMLYIYLRCTNMTNIHMTTIWLIKRQDILKINGHQIVPRHDPLIISTAFIWPEGCIFTD